MIGENLVKTKNIVLIGLLAVIVSYVPLLFINSDVVRYLTKEDGFFETVGVIFFFLASLVYLFAYLRLQQRNYFFLIFAFVFFFAAGEEISWGQRIFNFKTPEELSMQNAQKEFNIHNLFIFAIKDEEGHVGTQLFNRLFIVFWFVYCLLIPLLNKYNIFWRNLLRKICLPIVSVWFGFMFFFNDIFCKFLELSVFSPYPSHLKINEVKESMWAFLVFLMGVYFLSELLSKRKLNYDRN